MGNIIRAKVHHHAFGGNGECVAIVNFLDVVDLGVNTALDIAYHETNTLDHVWWENENVEMVGSAKEKGGCRSTSVGDRIVIERDDGSTETHEVASVGFSRVPEKGKS